MGNVRRPGGDQAATDQATGRRMTVPEAADALGILQDAVRSRIKRGTLATVRDGGRVFVALGGADQPTNQVSPTRSHPRCRARLTTSAGSWRPIGRRTPSRGRRGESPRPVPTTPSWSQDSVQRRPWWRRIIGGQGGEDDHGQASAGGVDRGPGRKAHP
jgi:hypothetical protein